MGTSTQLSIRSESELTDTGLDSADSSSITRDVAALTRELVTRARTVEPRIARDAVGSCLEILHVSTIWSTQERVRLRGVEVRDTATRGGASGAARARFPDRVAWVTEDAVLAGDESSLSGDPLAFTRLLFRMPDRGVDKVSDMLELLLDRKVLPRLRFAAVTIFSPPNNGFFLISLLPKLESEDLRELCLGAGRICGAGEPLVTERGLEKKMRSVLTTGFGIRL